MEQLSVIVYSKEKHSYGIKHRGLTTNMVTWMFYYRLKNSTMVIILNIGLNFFKSKAHLTYYFVATVLCGPPTDSTVVSGEYKKQTRARRRREALTVELDQVVISRVLMTLRIACMKSNASV